MERENQKHHLRLFVRVDVKENAYVYIDEASASISGCSSVCCEIISSFSNHFM